MSRPSDMPESVWDAATDIEIDADFSWDGQSFNSRQSEMETRIAIARAIMAERARTTDLVDCLSDMTEHYVQLVSCGDCGNWDAEEESEVIAARKMIAAYRGQS